MRLEDLPTHYMFAFVDPSFGSLRALQALQRGGHTSCGGHRGQRAGHSELCSFAPGGWRTLRIPAFGRIGIVMDIVSIIGSSHGSSSHI